MGLPWAAASLQARQTTREVAATPGGPNRVKKPGGVLRLDNGNGGCMLWVVSESRSQRMLDAYVIEEIKRRERKPERDERPVAEVPVPPPPDQFPVQPDPEKPSRGVVIIDLD